MGTLWVHKNGVRGAVGSRDDGSCKPLPPQPHILVQLLGRQTGRGDVEGGGVACEWGKECKST